MYSSIPLKQGQKTDLSSSLLKYAKKTLDNNSVTNLQKILPTIEDYRKKVISTKKYVNDDTLTTFITYYSYVKQIVKSFPVIEAQPVGLSVKWYDIHYKTSASTCNFVYEQGCVLANIAALHTQKALAYYEDTRTLENIQCVINEYEEAACCYMYIRQNIMNSCGQIQKTWDMTDDGLLALEYYCHGMSQLAICIKADMTGTKPVAKTVLMFGCKRLFSDAYKFFNICGVKDYTHRAKVLAYLCQCKGYLYQNDSAREKLESTGRGAGLCVGLCDEVKKMVQSLTTSGEYDRSTVNSLSDEINTIQKTAATQYSSAMSRNRIYLEASVPANEFPHIEPRVLRDLKEPNLPDIQEAVFDTMVPQSVVESLSRYRQFVNEKLEEGLRNIENANKELRDRQEELHVQEAIGACDADKGIPDDLWDLIETLQKELAIDTVEKSYDNVDGLVKKVNDKLVALFQSVNRQKQENLKYPSSPYTVNTSAAEETIDKCNSLLEQAKSGQKKIDECVAMVKDNASLLSSTRDALEQQLPKADLSPVCAQCMEELRTANNAVDQLIREREAKINEVIQLSNDDVSVRDELIRNRALDERGIFAHCFAPIQAKMSELDSNLDSQRSYIDNLQLKREAYVHVCNADPTIKNREAMIDKIRKAALNVQNAPQLIEQGKTFYISLDKMVEDARKGFNDAVERFQQNVGRESSSFGGYQSQFSPQGSQGSQFPPQGSQYPPHDSQFPPQGSQYPPHDSQFPPQGPQYPPQGSQFRPQGPQYPPQGSYYPPQGSSYPPYGQSNYRNQFPSGPGQNSNMTMCRRCNTPNYHHASYCVSCGSRLD